MNFPDDPDTLVTIAKQQPDFFHVVEEIRSKREALNLVLHGHQNNKELVWACLWYALNRGVMVTVAPQFVVTAGKDENISQSPDSQRSHADTVNLAEGSLTNTPVKDTPVENTLTKEADLDTSFDNL
jgi:hypothetical protein